MLVTELSSLEGKFFEYFRMSEDHSLHVLQLVEGGLVKNVTTFWRPISPQNGWPYA